MATLYNNKKEFSLSNKECSLLIEGYTRSFYQKQMSFDIMQLCVSFYSIWSDLRIVYCNSKNYAIDTTKFHIIQTPLNSPTLRQITEELENEMYRKAVCRTYYRLCKLSQYKLFQELYKFRWLPHVIPSTSKEELILEIMFKLFGRDVNWVAADLDKIEWKRGWGSRIIQEWHLGRQDNYCPIPLVRVWLKFKQIRHIYPVKTENICLDEELYENEDEDRWMELPDDCLNMTLDEITLGSFDKNEDCLVIERCNVYDWRRGKTPTWGIGCTWPMPRIKNEKGWKRRLKVGHIVGVDLSERTYRDRYSMGCWYEGVIRYIYPKDHETLSGSCVIHAIGLDKVRDVTVKIYSNKIEYRSNRHGPRENGWLDRFWKEEEEEDDDNSEKEAVRRYPGWVYENGWWERDWDYYDAFYYSGGCDMDTEEVIDYEFYENLLLDYEKPTISAHSGDFKMYESSKYSRKHKAKKIIHPKKKAFRKKWRKYGEKRGNKRIENKMKKYKIHYECLAY